MSDEEIARVCHEVNRTICHAFGDDSQVPWEEAPPWQRDSAIQGVRYLWNHPKAPESALHDAWVLNKLADGWVYGPVKDASADPPTHPCLVPFDALPTEQRLKDTLFRAIVLVLANC